MTKNLQDAYAQINNGESVAEVMAEFSQAQLLELADNSEYYDIPYFVIDEIYELLSQDWTDYDCREGH